MCPDKCRQSLQLIGVKQSVRDTNWQWWQSVIGTWSQLRRQQAAEKGRRDQDVWHCGAVSEASHRCLAFDLTRLIIAAAVAAAGARGNLQDGTVWADLLSITDWLVLAAAQPCWMQYSTMKHSNTQHPLSVSALARGSAG